jgi:anion-transporting  ArsA/GET3 family ATPase
MTATVSLADTLRDARLLMVVGSGGVGKTTTSAALALAAAQRGRRVVVLTIDPAKRLANSLGLDRMGGEPTPIDLGALKEGVAPGGALWALMLDARRTFDALILSVAPDRALAERILANGVYRAMADALAGSQDYMASEKLHDLLRDPRFDLVVIDTPPVENALDFLESPGRVVRFLDEKVVGWFVPGPSPAGLFAGLAKRLVAGPARVVQALLEAVFGTEFVADFTEFMTLFQALFRGFRDRHAAVAGDLRDARTRFVVVTAPTAASVRVASFFHRALAERALPYAGTVVNQLHGVADETPERVETWLSARMTPTEVEALMASLTTAHTERVALAEQERRVLAPLAPQMAADAATGAFWVRVRRQASDIHDLQALSRLGAAYDGVSDGS